jgi:MFS family permease
MLDTRAICARIAQQCKFLKWEQRLRKAPAPPKGGAATLRRNMPRPTVQRSPLPFAVLLLGLTSFFSDVASELVFPLLPAFLATLGASPVYLGLIEGVSDAVSSLLKLGSGYVADQASRRKPLVLAGYALAASVRPLVAFATAPWMVLAVRVTDRIGKGLRSSPRDALIAAVAHEGEAGRAFGFHRAMDHAGAVLGPLLGTLLLATGLTLPQVFLCAALPGALSALMVVFVREPDNPGRVAHSTSDLHADSRLPGELKRFFIILTLFSLVNASDAFLLLRAQELGVPTAHLPLLWSAFHVVKLISAYYGGGLSDLLPRSWLVAGGLVVYAVAYAGFALATEPTAVWALFFLYGGYYGLTEPAEKALVKDLTPPHLHGRAFGYYNFLLGASAIPAGALTGFLWKTQGAANALSLGAATALLASLALLVTAPRKSAAQ